MKRTANQQKRKTQPKTAEEEFLNAWERIGFSGSDLEREFKFHQSRMFRFDFAWPSLKIAIEVQGRGRHQTVTGVRSDCEKLTLAALGGWAVLYFPATDARAKNQWGESLLELFIEQLMELMELRYGQIKPKVSRLVRPQVESLQSLPTTPLGASPRSVSRSDTSRSGPNRRSAGQGRGQAGSSVRRAFRSAFRRPVK